MKQQQLTRAREQEQTRIACAAEYTQLAAGAAICFFAAAETQLGQDRHWRTQAWHYKGY
jgi:hypothetical protein